MYVPVVTDICGSVWRVERERVQRTSVDVKVDELRQIVERVPPEVGVFIDLDVYIEARERSITGEPLEPSGGFVPVTVPYTFRGISSVACSLLLSRPGLAEHLLLSRRHESWNLRVFESIDGEIVRKHFLSSFEFLVSDSEEGLHAMVRTFLDPWD